jgi:hypothetical protein
MFVGANKDDSPPAPVGLRSFGISSKIYKTLKKEELSRANIGTNADPTSQGWRLAL